MNILENVPADAWVGMSCLLKPTLPGITPSIIKEALTDYFESERSSRFSPPDKKRTELISIDEAADWLEVSPSTIYRMLGDGRLTRCKLGYKTTRIPVDSVEALIHRNERMATCRAALKTAGYTRGGKRA